MIRNNGTGVVATVDNADGGFGFVTGSGVNVISGNTAVGVRLSGQMQDQNVSGSPIGVEGSGMIGGASLALANNINGNTIGVGNFSGTIQFSRIDGNGTGIRATSNQQVLHNLIYNNTTVGLLVSGVANVQTSDNTFYAAAGDNIRIAGGSSNVEIQNSILWALNGYDIYVGDDSQTGYFSDYNTLFAGPNGVLVYWTRNFTDILDWQDDVALYDLHSTGSTLPNPTDGMPHFVDLTNSDFQLLPLAGGQTASDAALEQGNPIVEYDTQLQNGNLLANPGFEDGLTGWTTTSGAISGTAPSGPNAYDGDNYFYAGAVASGSAQQQVDLLAAGYSVAQIDSGSLTVTFGGYTRSLAKSAADTGSISVIFYGATSNELGSMTVDAANTTTQWSLTSGTIALPAGTRSVFFQFNAVRQTGANDDAFLDDSFVSLAAGAGPQSAVPGIGANYLTNPGFESGLDGWAASPGGGVASIGGTAFSGSSYFAAGAVQQGFVTQTVNLLNSGLTAGEIDGGGLNLVFGGRVISGDAFPPDTGQIEVTMLAANGSTVLGTSTVQAPNTTSRWALVGGTTALPPGTRYVQYTFTATKQTSESSDESFLDDAFVSTTPLGVPTSDGAYETPAVADPTTGPAQIALTSPVLYMNWIDNAPHTITWDNFGDAGASNQSVNIELYQLAAIGPGLPSEPKLLETIASAVANTGSYTWIPTPAIVPYGTYGLQIQVSLVSDPGVSSRSTEAFTVPENGDTYYVNDGSFADDQYTTTAGSNRNDGKLPSEPLPNIDNVLLNYTLTAGSTIDVDPGIYSMIEPFNISGNLNYGLGFDQGFTVQGPTNGSPAILQPAIPGDPVNLIQLEDAGFVTINDLTLQNAGRGVLVQDSAGFSATGLTISGMADEGIRIDTGSSVTLLSDLTVTNSGLSGIYVDGKTGAISDADVTNSGTAVPDDDIGDPAFESGIYLIDAGAASITGSTIFGNPDGIYVESGGGAMVGDAVLTNGDGNVIHDDADFGVFVTGAVTAAGNVVYDESDPGSFGIEVQSGATATENVVYAGLTGIIADDAASVTANRVYDNAGAGIDEINDQGFGNGTVAVTGNVIYSNATGILDNRNYGDTAVRIGNNLIYANAAAAITLLGNSGVLIINNTIDQPVGDGVSIIDDNSGTHLRNNILVIGAGIGINVGPGSETGFASDYNMFDLTSSTGGAIGQWQGVARLTLGAWQSATNTDPDSFTGNPDFVNPTGAEGVLGFVSPVAPGYDDDFHLASEYQDFRGGGTAPIINASGKPVFPAIVGGTDALQSPAIDRGNASDGFSNEPAPNGGYINLGNFGDTAQASESPSAYLLVLAPTAGETVQETAATTIAWRGSGFTGDVNISYSTNGATFTSIAAGVADTGNYAWSVPSGLTAGSTYVIQVAAISASVSGLSSQFAMSPPITDYYVNDGTPGQYTTAPGSNANNGLSPSTPKLSIQAILNAYTLGAGDTIFVDGGTYAIGNNITLTAANSGDAASPFSIIGQTNGTPTILNRGNLNSGTDVFKISGAKFVTLEDLTITGANAGIEITGAATGDQVLNDTVAKNGDIGIEVDFNGNGAAKAVTGLIIQGDTIDNNGLDTSLVNYGTVQAGVIVRQGNGGVDFINDQMFENDVAGIFLPDGTTGAGISTIDGGAYFGQSGAFDGTGYGIEDQTASLIENVEAYGNLGIGIYSQFEGAAAISPSGTISGNTVFGNAETGIDAFDAVVTDNLVYSQFNTSWDAIELSALSTGIGNTVFGGTGGIFVDATAEAIANLVYDISGHGIEYAQSPNIALQPGGPESIASNTLYGDGIGIFGQEQSSGLAASISGNLIYQNTTAAIALVGGTDQTLINNTIDQPAGNGIAISGGAASTTIENNIIDVATGAGITVSSNAETGFVSDYNLFDLTGTAAVIGTWENLSFASLASWYYELGLDQHSQATNPDFVSPAGADGILGFGSPTGSGQVIDNSVTTGTWTTETGGLNGTYLQTAAGSGATATWTFTGLTAGQTYEIAATWPESTATDLGNAHYIVTGGDGTVLTSAILDQYGVRPTGIANGNTTYALIGLFTATGTKAAVTLSGDATNAVIADATLLVPIGINGGADDDFHVRSGSPAIDSGNPTTPWLLEPAPNGSRVNLGYDGDTPNAQASPAATSIQVITPSGLAKYEIGAQVPIDFQTAGLTASQPVLLLHAGGSAIATALDGNWSGNEFLSSGTSISDPLSAAKIGTLANVPSALFASAAEAISANQGQALSFQLPVPNGTYTMTLYFADPQSNDTGECVFDIVANGQTLQAGYDIFAAAQTQYNDGNHAVTQTYTVTVTGGHGLALNFVNDAGTEFGALVNGIELTAATTGGTPSATVQVSTNGGATWSTVASNVAVNAYGQGQYVWTANATSNGNTALVRVLSGTASGTSQPFLLANNGTVFYVSGTSRAGAQYTTVMGDDANSGKSPDQPMASLAALLRAWPIGPGDTIVVDSGSYNQPTNIVLPAADSGTPTNPVVITGPTNGATAILNRGNTAAGTDVFDLRGVSNIVIQDLTIKGAYDGIDVVNGATGVTLLNDVIANNSNLGADAALNTGVLFKNDQVYGTGGAGLYLSGGGQTVQGGTYYSNGAGGIYANASGVLIADVTSHDNTGDGIQVNGGTVTGSTVYGNLASGIVAEGGLVSDNLVYDQVNYGILADMNATATGNTTFGDVTGISGGSGSVLQDNLAYYDSGSGLNYNSTVLYSGVNGPASIAGNTVYGDAVGILGDDIYASVTIAIDNNLIYQNTTAGIFLTDGTNQSIVNNTIDQPAGAGIWIAGSAAATTIQNNIIVIAAGPGLKVAPAAESGLASDYNLFDVTGTGSIANWETISYGGLASWYYATGFDQDSQTGDPAFVEPAGGNFHVQPGSPAIDAGNPASAFTAEPAPNGGRVNQGYDGETAQAQTSGAAQTIQVLTPAPFGKFEVGQQLPIDIASDDLGQSQAVLAMAAGGTAIATATEGNWQQSADQTSGTVFANFEPTITGLGTVPLSLFDNGAQANDTSQGTALSFALPVANGSYTLRLYFADTNSGAAGECVFNVVVNGTTMQANYDPFAAAGGANTAVELDLTVNVTAGNGIALSFVNAASSQYAAFVNAIEVDRLIPSGSPAPTLAIDASTDNGLSWTPIAVAVPVNRFGQAQYVWTVNGTSTDGGALIRVTSGSLTATSAPVTFANGGTVFYVNGASLTGAQYTTSVGNDANSGKSPNEPMASLAALLRAYPIGPGDTIEIDNGDYLATSNAILPANDSGAAANPVVITGPTNGGTAVIDRGNTVDATSVITDAGASDVTIENLTMTGADYGVIVRGIANAVTLANDSEFGDAVDGILTSDNGTLTSLAITDNAIHDNGGPGISLGTDVVSGALTNDQVYNNSGDGIDTGNLNQGAVLAISGGAVYDNMGVGLSILSAVTVSGEQVHGNAYDGIDADTSNGTPLITGNTIFSNAHAGIYADVATVTDNTVFDQVNTTDAAIELDYGATAIGNTVYGASTGLLLEDGGNQASGNLVYESSGDGISVTNYGSNTVSGNIAYGNEVGISSASPETAIENNLVYNNVSTSIAITNGTSVAIVDNTVYQPVGQALSVTGATGVTVENNILWVNTGDIINVGSASETGFVAAYNLYFQGTNSAQATLGLWGGVIETTLAKWQTASGQDTAGSKTGNPDFVNVAGADEILGGPGTVVGAGADDDFELQKGSPAIDAANAYAAPFTDLLGQPRHDDPATANSGIGFPLYVQTNGTAVASSGGTRLTVSPDGGVTTYNLPFAFSLYGTSYSSVVVSSQGFLQFAGPDPGDFLGDVRIAPYAADIDTGAISADGVFVAKTSTSVTFRWEAGTSGAAENFAVTLNSNGSFAFNYGTGNAGFNPVIGVSAGNSETYVLSSASGGANLNNAVQQTWTAQPGDIFFDIGAFEFQGNSSSTTPPMVVSVTPIPANNGTTGLAFTSLSVQFSEALDLVSAVSPANFTLIKADGNGQFNTNGAATIALTPVYTQGATTVTLRLPNGALASGEYQLTLSGTRAIFDTSGNALNAGSNYVTVFTIDRSADIAPVATARSVTVAESTTTQIVLAATDTQGNKLTYSVATQPTNGAVSAISNGNTLTYTPAADFQGADSFVFQATDPDGESSQATVSITVTPVDQAPVAAAQSVTVNHDAPRVIVLGGSDAETPASLLTYTVTAQPAHGTLTQNPGTPNAFTYTPAAGYLGADSFSFTVTDTGNPAGNLANAKTSTAAVVAILVVDPAPVGVATSYTVRQNVPLIVPAATGVLANDGDSAGDALTAALGSGPTHGSLTLNNDGSFTYTPAAGFTGADSFTYVPHGNYTAGAAATVTLNVVRPVTQAPAPAASGPGDLAAPPPGLLPSGGGHAGIAAAPVTPQPAPSVPSGTVSPRLVAVPMSATPPSFPDSWRTLPAPIVLPPSILTGEAVSSLLLPSIPRVTPLPEAYAAAVRRFAEPPPPVVTFIDPMSGLAGDDDTQALDQAWLLVDFPDDGQNMPKANIGGPSIRWDSHPP